MFNLKENKLAKIILFIIVLSGFVLVLANSQLKITEVSATVVAVTVQGDHLSFGTAFPGEELEGSFVIGYVEQPEPDDVDYRIVLERKPLPEGYIGEGDPDMPGYYKDLCPYLTKVNLEEEGDTEDNASVGVDDLSDEWTIYFKVPAIIGHVGQEHINGIVTTNGEYGCDISIEEPIIL